MLLQSLEKYWIAVSDTYNVTKVYQNHSWKMTITKFLSCFEVVTIPQRSSESEATTSAFEERFLRVRKNISLETLAKLGKRTV